MRVGSSVVLLCWKRTFGLHRDTTLVDLVMLDRVREPLSFFCRSEKNDKEEENG